MPFNAIIKSTNEKQLLRFPILIRECKQFINLEQAKLDNANATHVNIFDFLEEKRQEVDHLYKEYTFSINTSMKSNVLIKSELFDDAKKKLEGIKQSICEKVTCQ